MMVAYSQVNEFREVRSLFRWMQEVGTEPNESVLVSVLIARAHLGALAQGLWIRSYAKRYNLVFNPKCNCLESTLSVFKDIPNKDAGAWNAIISGATMNGDVRKLLNVFDKMTIDGTRPIETTFVALLTACKQARLVKDGLKLFEQMGTFYGVKPKFEHYACVVDLLARAGKLKEAEKFIEEEMGGVERADAYVWRAPLGACRVYQIVERMCYRTISIGKRAGK
ncbi:Pentatricopeptide repeat-containing protein [Camellia lanceoleosa]|uniref:Pentatricopeptide repeat-containing protein n=1 Tax=Camellia lanceoleosa TaxID=1840588 RepID=A0ACC0FMD8_9ERIC|nr:Pentatricopeptide repeat-containing protein [Camellia lanceoleosa]